MRWLALFLLAGCTLPQLQRGTAGAGGFGAMVTSASPMAGSWAPLVAEVGRVIEDSTQVLLQRMQAIEQARAAQGIPADKGLGWQEWLAILGLTGGTGIGVNALRDSKYAKAGKQMLLQPKDPAA